MPESVGTGGAPVVMIRANLEELPIWRMPVGVNVRPFRTGDESKWQAVQMDAEPYLEIGPDVFHSVFGNDVGALHERIMFAEGSGGAVGTAAAWFGGDEETPVDDSWGRLHWLAVRREYRRRGIGRALLGTVCQRLTELGHLRACLLTSADRLPAIRLYVDFGFVPLIRRPRDIPVWRGIEATLGQATSWQLHASDGRKA